MKAYTDYPITELGDVSGQPAPIRECTVLSWDGDKYCDILVEGIKTNIKRWYIYSQPGRATEVPHVTTDDLIKFHPSPTVYHAQELISSIPYYLTIESGLGYKVLDSSGSWCASFDDYCQASAFVRTREVVQAMVTHILDLENRLDEELRKPKHVFLPTDPVYEAKIDAMLLNANTGSRPIVKSLSNEENSK